MMGMTYYCHGCGNCLRGKKGRCPECGMREDVDSVINHVSAWKSLNEQAKTKYARIIEKGLDVSEVRS